MKVAVTGSTGLIGRHVSQMLRDRGDEVLAVRRDGGPGLEWSFERGFDPPDALSGIDVVIHLAGENIGDRWTQQRKQRIHDSRIRGTELVVEAIERASPRPRVLVSASAVGYYGDRQDEVLDEDSRGGAGFLAELTQKWEQRAERASSQATRVIRVRAGVVLAADGGALARMIAVFRWGLGGRFGSGRQWMSWIHVHDLGRALLHALDVGLTGPVNATAPEPVRNVEFTRLLGEALGRPTPFPAPAFALRLILGERAVPLLLEGQRVMPRRLLDSGFSFRFPDLRRALDDLLVDGRPSTSRSG